MYTHTAMVSTASKANKNPIGDCRPFWIVGSTIKACLIVSFGHQHTEFLFRSVFGKKASFSFTALEATRVAIILYLFKGKMVSTIPCSGNSNGFDLLSEYSSTL